MENKRYMWGEEVLLTKEKIKAIRVVLGLNSDLRVSIKNYDVDSMTYFLISVRYNLFPFNNEMTEIPDDLELREKWYYRMKREAYAVLRR